MSAEAPKSLTLFEHLAELRQRLIMSIWGILAGFVICHNIDQQLFAIIRAPIEPYLPAGGLVFTAPMDKFVAHLKIAFFGGVILACPWWIYQVWQFVAPGLYKREKKLAAGFIATGTFLFLVGVAFTYFIVFPMAFKFLMTYGGDLDKPMITIDQYLSFFVVTTLVFGVSFELPLVLVTLGMLGIVSQKFLRTYRRYAIVGLSGVAAIVTPPDLLSMVLMLVPMVLLYEISVILVGLVEKKSAEPAGDEAA